MSLDFIILGAQKAATSTLHQSLRGVAGIEMPPGESAFFEDPEYASSPWMSLAGARGVTGIKRPDYLCSDAARTRITHSVPHAKFIVVLREPIARTVSAYYHLVRHARLPVAPLDEVVIDALVSERAAEQSDLSSLIEYSMYGRHIQRWLEVAPRENFLFLAQSAVASDPLAAVQACCALLGVEAPQFTVAEQRNENVGIYDPRYLAAYRWGHRLKTRRLRGSTRRVPRRFLPARIAGAGLTRLATRLADASARPPELSAEVRSALVARFAPDTELLRSLVPAETVDWSFSLREGGQ